MAQARFTPQVIQGKNIICISNNNLNPTKLKPLSQLKKKVFWSAKPKSDINITVYANIYRAFREHRFKLSTVKTPRVLTLLKFQDTININDHLYNAP